MEKAKNKGFTLIEVLIVVAIIWILTVLLIVPYNLYTDIWRVRISKEIVNQTISEARNSSAWLINTSWNNQNIAIFLYKWSDKLKLIWFPFNYNWALTEWNWILIREIPFEKNVNLNKILDNNWNELSQVILYFVSPNGDMNAYINSTQTWTLKTLTIWIKESTTWILSKNIDIK